MSETVVVQPSQGARPATTLLHWKHPNRGEQEETLCEEHLADVRRALRTLGIGCIGSAPDTPSKCVRCCKQLPWRYYIVPDPPEAAS